MDAIRSWATALCFAAIVGGICLMLLPRSPLKKIVTLTVSVFFISCLLQPIGVVQTRKPGNSWEESRAKAESIAEDLSRNSEESAYQSAQANINKLVSKILADRGINPIKLAINTRPDPECEVCFLVEILLPQTAKQEEEELRTQLARVLPPELSLIELQFAPEQAEREED